MANPLYGQNKADSSMVQLLYQNANQVTHTNSTDAADLFSYSIPANKLEMNNIVRVKAFATVTDNNSTDTLTPVLKFGGTAIATGAALDVADSDIVYVWADVHVTKIGSAGTMTAISEIRTDALGATTVIAATSLTSKDTTGALAVALNVDWSVAHAENIVRLDAASIELL
tara:strand:+ start:703 stop:1215 length:513 start_codon:yes stop_codon:yes gene_type:complete